MSKMLPVTILSSSPVSVRSPTPVSSPSLPSPDALLNSNTPRHQRFKSTNPPGGLFGRGFTSAKTLLQPKFTAENIPPNRSSQGHVSSQGSPSKTPRFIVEGKKTDTLRPRDVATENMAKPGSQERTRCDTSTQIPDCLEFEKELDINNSPAVEMRKENIDYCLGLEKAVPRRLDWTPPKVVESVELESLQGQSALGVLLGSFVCPEGSTIQQTTSEDNDDERGSIKRRRLEEVSRDIKEPVSRRSTPSLVPSKRSPLKPADRRSKSPKKKALTITARATSQYFGEPEPEPTALERYLESGNDQSTEKDSPLPAKSSKKKPNKPQTKRGGKKKEPEAIVLSPDQAMKHYDSQDILFGSASQVAQDESPTFLRHIIQAMRESEASIDSDSRLGLNESIISTTSNGSRRSLTFLSSKSLWAAASLHDESILDVDTLDITRTPQPAVRAPNVDAAVDGWLDVDAVTARPATSPVYPPGGRSTLQSTVRPSLHIQDIAALSRPTVRGIHQTSQSKSKDQLEVDMEQSKAISDIREVIPTATSETVHLDTVQDPAPTVPPRPPFEGMTTAELSSKLKAYGFKPVRKRDKMIELLERCWKDEHGIPEPAEAEQEAPIISHGDILSNLHDIASRPVPKPLKQSTRKKKDAATTSQDQASSSVRKTSKRKKAKDLDDTVTESRTPNMQTATSSDSITTTLTSVPVDIIEANDVEEAPIENKPADEPSSNPMSEISLASQITLAITSYVPPPTHNHQRDPTFHERILMYDPIVLEDLAAWLNTTGLRAIGEDREVSALDVRAWCEQRGITCLALGGGWRGSGGKKEAGDEDED